MQYSHLRTTSLGIALLGTISMGLRLPAQQLSNTASQPAALSSHAAQIATTFQQSVTRGEYRAFNTGGEPGGLAILIALAISIGLYLSLRRASAWKQAQKTAAPVSSVSYISESHRTVPVTDMPLSEAPGSFV